MLSYWIGLQPWECFATGLGSSPGECFATGLGSSPGSALLLDWGPALGSALLLDWGPVLGSALLLDWGPALGSALLLDWGPALRSALLLDWGVLYYWTRVQSWGVLNCYWTGVQSWAVLCYWTGPVWDLNRKNSAGIFLPLQFTLPPRISTWLCHSTSFCSISFKFLSSHSFSLCIRLCPQCELILLYKEVGHLRRKVEGLGLQCAWLCKH